MVSSIATPSGLASSYSPLEALLDTPRRHHEDPPGSTVSPTGQWVLFSQCLLYPRYPNWLGPGFAFALSVILTHRKSTVQDSLCGVSALPPVPPAVFSRAYLKRAVTSTQRCSEQAPLFRDKLSHGSPLTPGLSPGSIASF